MAEPLFKPAMAALRAIIHILSHVAVAAVIIASIRGIELLIQWLWRNQDPLLFGFLPLQYLAHGSDLAVLVVFVVFGIVSIVRGFRDNGR